MTDPAITVTPTFQFGTVVRWYHPGDATSGNAIVSASRRGVMINGDVYLTDIPETWIDAARQAHAALARDPRADLSHMATHRRCQLFGPLEPVPADIAREDPDHA